MTAFPLFNASIGIIRVLWSSIAGTVVVALLFALLIRFLIRFSEMRTIRRRGATVLYGALSAVALGAFAAVVVYGLVLLTQKS